MRLESTIRLVAVFRFARERLDGLHAAEGVRRNEAARGTANEKGIDRGGSCGERVRSLVPWAGKMVWTGMDRSIDMETIGTTYLGVARMGRPEPAVVGPRFAKRLLQRRPIGNGQFRLDSRESVIWSWSGGRHGFLKIERVDV